MAADSIEKELSISSDEKVGSKPYAAAYTLDTAAVLFAAEDITLTPEEANRLRRKIDWHVLPLMYGASTFIVPLMCHN
jgi:ACS family allantoate permease-like MFS transporter